MTFWILMLLAIALQAAGQVLQKQMVGHKTEAIYRRYAIVDEAMMREGADKLARYERSNKMESLGEVAEQGKDLGKVAGNPGLASKNLPPN